MIGLDDVAELRSLLRRRDPVARQMALATLATWSAPMLDATGGRAVLEAASGSYPSIQGDPVLPAELLAQLLWTRPRLVPTADVLRVYLVAGERVRRAFLHLLALRRDEDGLDALDFLLGSSGPRALLPTPTTPVLDPLLEMNEPERIVPTLLGVIRTTAWTWHAAELIGRLAQLGRLDVGVRSDVVAEVTRCVDQLVDTCDRACGSDSKSGDPVRSDRERLGSLARLLDRLRDVDQLDVLHRMMASADPRVSAMGASRLVQVGEPIAPERLGLIARDPIARADLYDGLAPNGRIDNLPPEITVESIQEAMLTRWLADVTELGRAPDEMEFVGERTIRSQGPAVAPDCDDETCSTDCTAAECAPTEYAETVYLFRFRMNSPHWSSARGWMIGAAGAYTYSCYAAEDECSLDAHVETIRSTLADWPDRRADGAA